MANLSCVCFGGDDAPSGDQRRHAVEFVSVIYISQWDTQQIRMSGCTILFVGELRTCEIRVVAVG